MQFENTIPQPYSSRAPTVTIDVSFSVKTTAYDVFDIAYTAKLSGTYIADSLVWERTTNGGETWQTITIDADGIRAMTHDTLRAGYGIRARVTYYYVIGYESTLLKYAVEQRHAYSGTVWEA